MPKPKRPRWNRARETRIIDEVVVDAYTSDEQAMSWYYYLEATREAMQDWRYWVAMGYVF